MDKLEEIDILLKKKCKKKNCKNCCRKKKKHKPSCPKFRPPSSRPSTAKIRSLLEESNTNTNTNVNDNINTNINLETESQISVFENKPPDNTENNEEKQSKNSSFFSKLLGHDGKILGDSVLYGAIIPFVIVWIIYELVPIRSMTKNAKPNRINDNRVVLYDKDGNITANNVIIGTDNSKASLEINGPEACLSLKNTTNENTDGGAETQIQFKDHSNSILAQIQGSHYGINNDSQSRLSFSINAPIQNTFKLFSAINIEPDFLNNDAWVHTHIRDFVTIADTADMRKDLASSLVLVGNSWHSRRLIGTAPNLVPRGSGNSNDYPIISLISNIDFYHNNVSSNIVLYNNCNLGTIDFMDKQNGYLGGFVLRHDGENTINGEDGKLYPDNKSKLILGLADGNHKDRADTVLEITTEKTEIKNAVDVIGRIKKTGDATWIHDTTATQLIGWGDCAINITQTYDGRHYEPGTTTAPGGLGGANDCAGNAIAIRSYHDRTDENEHIWLIGLDADSNSSRQDTGGPHPELVFEYRTTSTNSIRYGLIGNSLHTGGRGNSSANALDFTGQHKCYGENNDTIDYTQYFGYITVSTGVYNSQSTGADTTYKNNIQINEALPIVRLSNKNNQKSVFGVISFIETDQTKTRTYQSAIRVSYDKPEGDNRLTVNSLGEGAIWVCNYNGNFENGDYITSCVVPGLGAKQENDTLHNYTVAKITCDVDFDNLSQTDPFHFKELEHDGTTYKCVFVGCTYHCG